MLEKLDDIPWSGLTHAYGSAADVPSQIRTLLSEDPATVRSVLFTFTCNIFHQGSIYPATVAATPFLIELLQHDSEATQIGILDLLVHFATGYPEGPFTRAEVWESALPKAVEDDDADGDDERIWWECYAEIATGIPKYVELLHCKPPVAIAASRLLAFLPCHAYNAGEHLLNVARNNRADKLLRTSCLMALGYMEGANVGRETTLYCDTIVAQCQDASRTLTEIEAAATFVLLAVEEPSVAIDQTHLKFVADQSLKHGIEIPKPDYYDQRKEVDVDDIETSTDYYKAFLEPVAEFPWRIESEIQREIRKRFKRSETPNQQPSEMTVEIDSDQEDEFSITKVIAELRQCSDYERASSLADMLLLDAFGPYNGVTYFEFSERAFPVDDWKDRQKAVLRAIADCEKLWPKIAYELRAYLDLDFDPKRQELCDALAGKPQQEPDKEEPGEPDLSPDGVIAATVRLYESFAIKRRNISAELNRYAPYLPHSSAGLEFLTMKLTKGETLVERKSAAWALGRLREHASPAAAVLIKQIQEDPDNEYARSALSYIPIPDSLVDELLDQIESSEAVDNFLLRAVEGRIPLARLKSWLNSARLRRLALRYLMAIDTVLVKDELLVELDSEDEGKADYAQQCLANPAFTPWFLNNLKTLPPAHRLAISQGYGQRWIDFGDHRELIYDAIEGSQDSELAGNLLGAIQGFREKTTEDVERCGQLVGQFDSREWKLEVIAALRQFEASEFEKQVFSSLQPLLFDEDEYVRTSAVNVVPLALDNQELINALWSDSSYLVRRALLWKLSRSGQDACEILIRHLREELDDRVGMGIVWCLKANRACTDELSTVDFVEMPIANNLACCSSY